MITTQDYKCELMINYINRAPYVRELSKEEIFWVINDKFSDDQAEQKLEAMIKAGLELEEIVLFALQVTS